MELENIVNGIIKHQHTLQSQQKNLTESVKNSDLYKCPLCKDTGWILGENGRYHECECRKKDRIEKAWKSSGINLNDLNKNFGNFETWNNKSEEMKNKAIDYYKQFENIKAERRNSIMFSGTPGSGKTHLCLALANNLIKTKKVKVVYMPYRDIITKIKQNMLDQEYYKKILNRYQKAEVLLIDDLYKGKITDSDINIMFELVNYRYLNYLPIIVSTEFTVDKLLDFDEAIGSRLYEMSRDYLIEITDRKNNYRLR